MTFLDIAFKNIVNLLINFDDIQFRFFGLYKIGFSVKSSIETNGKMCVQNVAR
jgi:hypothetical protein